MEIDYSVIPEIAVSYSDMVRTSERVAIHSSHNANEIFRQKFQSFMQHHEECWVMYLNSVNKVMGIYQVSKNGITNAYVDIRIVLQIALKTNAVGIAVAHNHPSGSVHPSHEDKRLTQKIQEACVILNIKLLDHLILSDERYFSFADEGLL